MKKVWVKTQVRGLSALLTGALCFGCTPKSTPSEKKDESAPSAGASSEKPKCASGKDPQILSGNCSGVWRFEMREGKSLCTFDWGPTIRCPAGTTPIGYEAVCYGATEKTPTSKAESAKDCAGQFGANPASPAYTLTCCPP